MTTTTLWYDEPAKRWKSDIEDVSIVEIGGAFAYGEATFNILDLVPDDGIVRVYPSHLSTSEYRAKVQELFAR